MATQTLVDERPDRPDRPVKVLVVCRQNRVRSPLLAGLLRRRLPATVVVDSAGVSGPAGSPAPEVAVRAAAAVGVDLTSHRSRLLDPSELGRATVVLAMTEQLRGELTALALTARGRVFTVLELARLLNYQVAGDTLEATVRELDAMRVVRVRPVAAEDIQDPTGMSSAAYDSVAADLRRLSDHFERRLRLVTAAGPGV